MSNKTLIAVTIVCVTSIVFSGFNMYLIFKNARMQEEQIYEIKTSINEALSRIYDLNVNFSYALKSLNQSMLNNIEDVSTSLNSTFNNLYFNASKITGNFSYVESEVTRLEESLEEYLNRTPASVYNAAHRSVVIIRTPSGQGSGFLYSAQNIILTNYHVIEGETEINIEYYDRSRETAILVGSDPYSDIAVLKVYKAPADTMPLNLGNSSRVWIGQQVAAIGNPLGLTGSLSSGFVSQVNEVIDLPPIIVPVLQLDVTMAPGSSGGPLLDLFGKVIGITNAGTGYGFNFAIPSNIVSRVATSIIEKGSFDHPYVGFSGVVLTPETINEYNVINVEPFQTGIMIMDVISGYPAEKSGLQPAIETEINGERAYIAKDIVTGIDNRPIITFADWSAYFAEYVSPNQKIMLTLWRSGEIVTVEVITTNRPPL